MSVTWENYRQWTARQSQTKVHVEHSWSGTIMSPSKEFAEPSAMEDAEATETVTIAKNSASEHATLLQEPSQQVYTQGRNKKRFRMSSTVYCDGSNASYPPRCTWGRVWCRSVENRCVVLHSIPLCNFMCLLSFTCIITPCLFSACWYISFCFHCGAWFNIYCFFSPVLCWYLTFWINFMH